MSPHWWLHLHQQLTVFLYWKSVYKLWFHLEYRQIFQFYKLIPHYSGRQLFQLLEYCCLTFEPNNAICLRINQKKLKFWIHRQHFPKKNCFSTVRLHHPKLNMLHKDYHLRLKRKCLSNFSTFHFII